MSIANIDVGAAEDWAKRLKAEIDEIAPIINQVDNVWEDGPNSDTITGKIAEKVGQLDESWIRAIDIAYQGIDGILKAIVKFHKAIEEAIEKIADMF